ncbi:MAG: hypothetical protein WBL74_07425 [Novosphingobium sp.]|uniref:hypothetical protein n=1 Tax=Novosphingobium sp. TaxID=1874826 RepID=UPI003C7DB677
MDRAFKIIGALGLSISAGTLLGMSTPTAMKAAPEPEWRMAARSANAGKPIELSQPEVVYSSMPEDLSPQVGYGSPAAYQAYYVDAPVRTQYTAVPVYAVIPLASQPLRSSADAPTLAVRDAQTRAQTSLEPVRLASAKTIDMPNAASNSEHEPVFDTTGDAPAMDADGEN